MLLQQSCPSFARNSYDEYGIPGSTNYGRFQYTGQTWLPELGMYHYKARIYSPTLGRFLQTDPIGYADQANLYAYVRNDPVNFIDPTGMRSCGPGEVPVFQAIPYPSDAGEGDVMASGRYFCFALPQSEGGRGGGSGGGEAGGGGEQPNAERRQRPNYCRSFLYQRGAAWRKGGSTITTIGLGLAGVGAVVGGIGATPGLAIAAFGTSLSTIGTLQQTIAGSGTAPFRAIIELGGGRAASILTKSPLGQELLGEGAARAVEGILDECR